MTTATVGTKFNRDRSTKEIAALVRAEIKAAVKGGELPAGEYSVRCGISTHTHTIDIVATVTGIRHYDELRLIADRDAPHDHSGRGWQSAEAAAVSAKLEAMLAAYNRESHDSQSDYYNAHFMPSVSVCGAADSRASEMAQLPARGTPAAAAMLRAAFGVEPVAANDDAMDAVYEARNRAERAELARDERYDACPAAWSHAPGYGCSLCEV